MAISRGGLRISPVQSFPAAFSVVIGRCVTSLIRGSHIRLSTLVCISPQKNQHYKHHAIHTRSSAMTGNANTWQTLMMLCSRRGWVWYINAWKWDIHGHRSMHLWINKIGRKSLDIVKKKSPQPIASWRGLGRWPLRKMSSCNFYPVGVHNLAINSRFFQMGILRKRTKFLAV